VCCFDTDTSEGVAEMPIKVDVSYFRNLIQTETDRLRMLCAVWRSTMEHLTDVSDEGYSVNYASLTDC